MTPIQAPPLYRIAITQLVVLAVLAVIMLVVGKAEAYSVLIGGLIHIAPQAWFSRMAYRYQGARQAPKILNAMYKGAAGKLLLTASMFAVVFVFIKPLHLPALFVSYMVMVLVYGYSAAKLLR